MARCETSEGDELRARDHDSLWLITENHDVATKARAQGAFTHARAKAIEQLGFDQPMRAIAKIGECRPEEIQIYLPDLG